MRKAGILMHISSLPSPHGIGTLGKVAHEFAEFLHRAGFSLWQILPIGPTGYGDSPYQSFSSHAGNPYFIDLDRLVSDGLLTHSECADFDFGNTPDSVDYGALYENRFALLRRAVPRFFAAEPKGFSAFCENNSNWLDDYALFSVIKEKNGQKPWQEWDASLKNRDDKALSEIEDEYVSDIKFYKMLQYLFYSQWQDLREHCRALGVSIIGDLPIYAASDSADTWAHPEYFSFDENLSLSLVAGCPPDSFSKDGQYWGNPTYDWDAIRADGYRFWIDRLNTALASFDYLRIDHFRAFDEYYAIPAGHHPADGKWMRGPGREFFDFMRAEFDDLPIIAEDLGFITESVRELLKYTDFPGMKVLQFGFYEGAEEYLPYNYPTNSIAYTGTHDNATMKEFFESADDRDRDFAYSYLDACNADDATACAVREVMASASRFAVIPMQDILCLGANARMNTPSLPSGNWRWRMTHMPDSVTEKTLSRMCRVYGRE